MHAGITHSQCVPYKTRQKMFYILNPCLLHFWNPVKSSFFVNSFVLVFLNLPREILGNLKKRKVLGTYQRFCCCCVLYICPVFINVNLYNYFCFDFNYSFSFFFNQNSWGGEKKGVQIGCSFLFCCRIHKIYIFKRVFRTSDLTKKENLDHQQTWRKKQRRSSTRKIKSDAQCAVFPESLATFF